MYLIGACTEDVAAIFPSTTSPILLASVSLPKKYSTLAFSAVVFSLL